MEREWEGTSAESVEKKSDYVIPVGEDHPNHAAGREAARVSFDETTLWFLPSSFPVMWSLRDWCVSGSFDPTRRTESIRPFLSRAYVIAQRKRMNEMERNKLIQREMTKKYKEKERDT